MLRMKMESSDREISTLRQQLTMVSNQKLELERLKSEY